MFEKLIYALAAFTLVLFLITIFYKGFTVKTCLLFILSGLPLMNLKITPEPLGGFKTFDFICFFCLFFLLKEFITIRLNRQKNAYLVFFTVLSVIFLLSGLSSEFPDTTWVSFLKFLPIFIFGRFLFITCYSDPQFYLSVINALKISYVMAILFLIGQVIFGLRFTFYPDLGPNTIDPVLNIVRYPGIFYDAQAHGQYLAMGSFLFLHVEAGKSKRYKFLNYVVFFLAMVALLLSGSRAPIGGLIAGVVFIVFMLSGKYRLYSSVFIVLTLASYLIVAPQSGIFKRTANISEDFKFRETLWNEAYGIAQDHPLLGIGAGNYQGHVLRHNQNQYLEIEEGVLLYFDQPENGYLKILVELGFIGFGIFLLMLFIPLLRGTTGYFKKYFDFKILLLVAALISWLVAFNTVYAIYDYRIMILMATLVILILSYPYKHADETDL